MIAVAVLVFLVIAAVPLLFSTRFAINSVGEVIASNVRGDVKVSSVSFSWTDGITIEGLEISNPPEFDKERPALRLKSLTADATFGSLLSGKPSFTLHIDGLETFIEQDDAGSSNLQMLAETTTTTSPESPAPDTPRDSSDDDALADIAFDVKLTNCAIEVRRKGEVLESMRDLNVRAFNASGSTLIRADASAKLLAGDISLTADMNAANGQGDAKLISHGLDLANWQPLISAFLPDQITALNGKVDGELTAILHGDEQVELGGELIVDAPRIAGPIVQDMDLSSAQWKLAPALALGTGANQNIDASKFAIDLGWLQINGKQSEDASKVRLAYDVDVATLATFGGPIPEMLKDSGTRLTGELFVPTSDLPTDAAGWTKALAVNADVQVNQLDISGFQLRDLAAAATVENGAFVLSTKESTKLDGGPLLASISVDLNDFDQLLTKASLSWQGGKLTGGTTGLLRYAMPLFAGLDPDVAQVVGNCNLEINLTGPASRSQDMGWLAWFDTWNGNGTLGLQNAAFAPSGELQGLLSPLGSLSKDVAKVSENGQLKIDSFRAPFEFAKGLVQTKATEWLADGQKIGLAGNVHTNGKLDYSLDFSALLKGHRDGEKVLKFLNGKLPPATLAGTLDDPSLATPNLENIAQQVLESQGKDLLRKGLESLFKK